MFELVSTSDFPESYDVCFRGEWVGSCRVSCQFLSAECQGVTVYGADVEGYHRMTPDERPEHLRNVCAAMLSALAADGMVWDLYTIE